MQPPCLPASLTPDEFESYRAAGVAMGFKFVASGPLVRSSYRAAEAFLTGILGEAFADRYGKKIGPATPGTPAPCARRNHRRARRTSLDQDARTELVLLERALRLVLELLDLLLGEGPPRVVRALDLPAPERAADYSVTAPAARANALRAPGLGLARDADEPLSARAAGPQGRRHLRCPHPWTPTLPLRARRAE